MKVIIKATGEIREVSLGYAVNYLIPRQLAQTATAERLKAAQKEVAAKAEVKKSQANEDHQLAERLNGKVITFKRESGKNGQIHGSITKKEIAEELKIMKTSVVLAKPIKKIGDYDIMLKFGVASANIKVKVL